MAEVENGESQRGRSRSRAKEVVEPQEVSPASGETDARPLQSIEQAMDDVRAMGRAAIAPAATVRVGEAAADADVTNEVAGGGVAFGTFVKSVGLAVAEAQTELDKSLQETAKKLSDISIDVVAVFEQQISDDDGLMKEGIPHIQKLPLVNYVPLTALHWTRVFLEADMNVKEFNSRTGFNIQQSATSANAKIGGGLFSGFGGSASGSYRQSNTGVDSSYSQDTAAGRLHMEATLEPRTDVEVPRPFVLQKGPRLQVVVGGRSPILDKEGKTIGQQAEIGVTLTKTSGVPNANKTLAVALSDPALRFTGTPTTGSDGTAKLTVLRDGANYDPATPVRALIRLSFGLVTESAGLIL